MRARRSPIDVILFIGHHKVGSSSLQRFLSHNFVPLARAGILYPAVESEGFAHHLAAALSGAPPPFELPINAREAHNALAFKMMAEGTERRVPGFHRDIPASRQMFVAICNQIDVLQPHAVILCAEVFANFSAVNPALIGRLAEAFEGHTVRLMCTLRRPDDYLASWYGQELKFGRRMPPLHRGGAAAYYESIHFDYAMMLEGWTGTFGAEALCLRNYADVLAAGGSIEDFKAQSGLDFPADLEPVENANPSIPRALFEIARRAANQLEPPLARRLRERLIRLAGRAELPPDREVELFGPGVRRELVARFAPIAERLEALHGRPLFADLAAMEEVRPIPLVRATEGAFAALEPALRERSTEPEIRGFLDRFKVGA